MSRIHIIRMIKKRYSVNKPWLLGTPPLSNFLPSFSASWLSPLWPLCQMATQLQASHQRSKWEEGGKEVVPFLSVLFIKNQKHSGNCLHRCLFTSQCPESATGPLSRCHEGRKSTATKVNKEPFETGQADSCVWWGILSKRFHLWEAKTKSVSEKRNPW